MANHPLVLKLWYPNMQFSEDYLTRVPIWVKLFNIPFKYWTVMEMSFVARSIGVPPSF